MDLNSHEYRIVRFLSKVKQTGLLTYAHLKFLKPVGNDYKRLLAREEEVLPLSDAEFDLEKMREIFNEREYMTNAQFDVSVEDLKSKGMMDDKRVEATLPALMVYTTKESEEKIRRDALIAEKRAAKEI